MHLEIIPPIIGSIGLLIAFVIYHRVKQYSPGEGKVIEIGDAIHIVSLVIAPLL